MSILAETKNKSKKNREVGIGLVLYAVIKIIDRFSELPEIVYRVGLIIAAIFLLYGIYSINREITERQKAEKEKSKE